MLLHDAFSVFTLPSASSSSIRQLLLLLPLRVWSLAFCPEVTAVMDVPARADSDPRRFQAAGGGLWPPVNSHDSTEGRTTGGGGGDKPMQMFTFDTGLLPESQTSGAGVPLHTSRPNTLRCREGAHELTRTQTRHNTEILFPILRVLESDPRCGAL